MSRTRIDEKEVDKCRCLGVISYSDYREPAVTTGEARRLRLSLPNSTIRRIFTFP